MTLIEAIAMYLGISEEEAEMIDPCDLMDEDMDAIDALCSE